MHRSKKILIGSFLLVGLVGAAVWSRHTNKKKHTSTAIKTEAPARKDIINKRVISGKLFPHKEAALKTQMSGILDKFYVAVGDQVKPGTPIARLKALPTSKTVEDAEKALRKAQRELAVEEANYQRNKQLFEKKMLSLVVYKKAVREWERASEGVTDAKNYLDFILKGHIAGAKGASNIITATIGGVVSELLCEEGSIVSPYSTYSEGKPIATISDMSTILFQGQVGEMDVAHLSKGMQFEVSLTAIKGKKFITILTKVAPKSSSNKENRSVKFDIEGKLAVNLEDKESIRVGYTAMADIVIEQAKDVLAIPEKCLHQDPKATAGGSFVWIYKNGQKTKKSVQLGISDGIRVEVKKGLTENDQVIVADDTH